MTPNKQNNKHFSKLLNVLQKINGFHSEASKRWQQPYLSFFCVLFVAGNQAFNRSKIDL